MHVNPVLTDLFNDYNEAVNKIARREHRGVRTIEVDDIAQHVWAVISQKSIDPGHSTGTDFRTWEFRGVCDLITKIAREYVARERID